MRSRGKRKKEMREEDYYSGMVEDSVRNESNGLSKRTENKKLQGSSNWQFLLVARSTGCGVLKNSTITVLKTFGTVALSITAREFSNING